MFFIFNFFTFGDLFWKGTSLHHILTSVCKKLVDITHNNPLCLAAVNRMGIFHIQRVKAKLKTLKQRDTSKQWKMSRLLVLDELVLYHM